MKRYSLLLLSIIVFCLLSCNKQQASTDTRPNILFIMTDDHSYQTFSAYDDRFIQTPHLDRIANEGVLFANSFVANSICAPSRAVMLTGKHSHMNGQLDNRIRFDSSQNTLPKYLQAAGYQTALVGKWHLKSQPTGFDHWEVLIGQGHYYNSDFIENGTRRTVEGYVTDVITDKGLAWLEQRDKSKPFSLMVHHKATHRTWMPDTALFQEFAGTEFDVPDNFFDTYEGRQAAEEQAMSIDKNMDLVWDNKMLDKEEEIQSRLRKNFERGQYGRMNEAQMAAWDAYYDPQIEAFKAANLSGKELALWKYQRYMMDYLQCVRSVDNNVGRLLDYLEANDLLDNTLIVYTSDQGFYMGEHGWFDKRFMYEQSLRTPLVMRLPNSMKKRGTIDELVQNIDYAPTFMEVAGLEVPADMQGLSLLPLLKGETEDLRDELYYHYYEYPGAHSVKRHYGIRTDRYKLMHFYHDIDTWELFDLEKDPEEMQNLFGDANYAEVQADLKQRLDALQEQFAVTETSVE